MFPNPLQIKTRGVATKAAVNATVKIGTIIKFAKSDRKETPSKWLIKTGKIKN